ncbi:hypothetical protein AGABI1DRAFT_134445 [Agaricus bisporus var. burnettii JB137-S8]|uniref:Uncharacterized protein n=1 Tax=Agaricus bisporus var. burnettii (strain JB137-S8 / ATCC MYA-4627 / FGSC 10392) TaxID=597362 RepID=K5VH13_AGABU|nr:uncharacterized protein AGABI1DRAFT_134445 [Agaricus bisporus var. burnettii JB137-S8]EKM73589.1 hypothetical protein AGABI1DRAFT_134445 [Agaricus bisporus var. burnettii JB137-S8]
MLCKAAKPPTPTEALAALMGLSAIAERHGPKPFEAVEKSKINKIQYKIKESSPRDDFRLIMIHSKWQCYRTAIWNTARIPSIYDTK